MLDPEYINVISDKCYLNATKNDVLKTRSNRSTEEAARCLASFGYAKY